MCVSLCDWVGVSLLYSLHAVRNGAYELLTHWSSSRGVGDVAGLRCSCTRLLLQRRDAAAAAATSGCQMGPGGRGVAGIALLTAALRDAGRVDVANLSPWCWVREHYAICPEVEEPREQSCREILRSRGASQPRWSGRRRCPRDNLQIGPIFFFSLPDARMYG